VCSLCGGETGSVQNGGRGAALIEISNLGRVAKAQFPVRKNGLRGFGARILHDDKSIGWAVLTSYICKSLGAGEMRVGVGSTGGAPMVFHSSLVACICSSPECSL